jgi:hypothetical protein
MAAHSLPWRRSSTISSTDSALASSWLSPWVSWSGQPEASAYGARVCEQRTQPVVLAPRLAGAGVCVPDDDQGPRAPLGRERLVEGGLVERVGQPSLGLAEGHPGHLVDLVVDDVALDGVVAHDPAVPVGHRLHPVAVGVALGSERSAQPDPHARLLADLADRGHGRELTAVELALGEGPVAVPWPVHQQHGVLADHDSTGGQHVPDRPGGGRHGG